METASALSLNSGTEGLLLDDAAPPAAILRGTARGLEIHIHGKQTTTAIVAAVMKRLDEAPTFFRGSDCRIRVEDGPLAGGCLARLDEIAVMFELRIVEVSAVERRTAKGTVTDADAIPVANLATGSAPSPAKADADFGEEEPTGSHAKIIALAIPPGGVNPPDSISGPPGNLAQAVELADSELLELESLDAVTVTGEALDALTHLAPGTAVEGEGISFEEPTGAAVPLQLASTPELPRLDDPGVRIVIGPVRSGVILEHLGHLFIFGDINPGAEVRASGNIVVLGRLRGTAHAGIGQDVGFILALRLEPQQLRVGQKVARAAAGDAPASEPELAYVTNGAIVVERYAGRLPSHLATSI